MLYIIAPHVVAPGQMPTAAQMAHEVGESARRTDGFVGRLVGTNRARTDEVWSIVAWKDRAAFDGWLKVRKFWWTTDDLHRVYSQGALVQDAEYFDLMDEQGAYFEVSPPEGAVLGETRDDLPVTVVAPHVIEPSELDLAKRMIHEVGESIRKASGFVGRIELQSQRSPYRIWSVSSWRRQADFEAWKNARKFWWTPDDVKRVFPEGALAEDAKQLDVVSRQSPLKT